LEPTLIASFKQKAPQNMGAKTHNKALKREKLQLAIGPLVTYFAHYHVSLNGVLGLKEYELTISLTKVALGNIEKGVRII
jgi:hypothetical protein